MLPKVCVGCIGVPPPPPPPPPGGGGGGGECQPDNRQRRDCQDLNRCEDLYAERIVTYVELSNKPETVRDCAFTGCHDGIQNWGEVEIDCGGPYCPACPALEQPILPYFSIWRRIQNFASAEIPPFVVSVVKGVFIVPKLIYGGSYDFIINRYLPWSKSVILGTGAIIGNSVSYVGKGIGYIVVSVYEFVKEDFIPWISFVTKDFFRINFNALLILITSLLLFLAAHSYMKYERPLYKKYEQQNRLHAREKEQRRITHEKELKTREAERKKRDALAKRRKIEEEKQRKQEEKLREQQKRQEARSKKLELGLLLRQRKEEDKRREQLRKEEEKERLAQEKQRSLEQEKQRKIEQKKEDALKKKQHC